jgi:hypothetical protein
MDLKRLAASLGNFSRYHPGKKYERGKEKLGRFEEK